ncbi:MAG: hypothetical protein ACK4VN_04510 [Bacteroidales bacterium]
MFANKTPTPIETASMEIPRKGGAAYDPFKTYCLWMNNKAQGMINKGILLLLMLMVLGISSCSTVRKRKCDCPRWSMETPEKINLSDPIDASQA